MASERRSSFSASPARALAAANTPAATTITAMSSFIRSPNNGIAKGLPRTGQGDALPAPNISRGAVLQKEIGNLDAENYVRKMRRNSKPGKWRSLRSPQEGKITGERNTCEARLIERD